MLEQVAAKWYKQPLTQTLKDHFNGNMGCTGQNIQSSALKITQQIHFSRNMIGWWIFTAHRSIPDRWLQDSLIKRNPPGRSQPNIFSDRHLSSSSLTYIRSQLEKIQSMLAGQEINAINWINSLTMILNINKKNYAPVLGNFQLGDICLEESDIVMMTIVPSILFHKSFHKIHCSNMLCPGQQMLRETAEHKHNSIIHNRIIDSCQKMFTMITKRSWN